VPLDGYFVALAAERASCTLWNDLAALLKRNGLRHCSSHSLRHYFCSTLIDSGIPVRGGSEECRARGFRWSGLQPS